MEDRIIIQNQVAIINFLGVVIKELTGKIPSVVLQREDGYIEIMPTMSSIQYRDVDLLTSCQHLVGNAKLT